MPAQDAGHLSVLLLRAWEVEKNPGPKWPCGIWKRMQVGQLNLVSVVHGDWSGFVGKERGGKNGHEWSYGECAAALVGVEKSCRKYGGKEDVRKLVRDKFLLCKNLIRGYVKMRCKMCNGVVHK